MAPNALKRLSVALRFTNNSSPKAQAISDTNALSQFLASTKEQYLQDIKKEGEEGGEWTVSMGNEAGDLDSLACSIAFAWLYSTVNKKQSIPLIQTEKDDLHLREENLYAFSLAGLKNPADTLLSITDVDTLKPFPSHKFALVDHNRLGERFTTDSPSAEVVAVVDHHKDEELYHDTAEPRIIKECGSCASHVALLLPEEVPPELATLLLCAILIDTGGLKPGGKANDIDKNAASTLVPRSTYASFVPPSYTGDKLHEAPVLKDLTKTLLNKKADVSRLSALDLLRRDYKEYSYSLGWAPNQPTIKAGLSTVPSGLAAWATKGKLLEASQEWMKARGLTVLGVLTSFRDEKRFTKSGKGKHRREQVWIIRQEDNAEGEGAVVDIDTLADKLWAGLQADDDLRLKKHKKFELVPKNGKLPENMRWKGYKQKNADATRKTTAPLLKKILEGEAPAEAGLLDQSGAGADGEAEAPTAEAAEDRA